SLFPSAGRRFTIAARPRFRPPAEAPAMLTLTTLTLFALLPAADAPVEAAVVIRGATLYDGSGRPGFKGDLALKGERIVAVGTVTVAGTPQVIDGTGLAVAPGFIDLHTHSDTVLPRPKTRANECYLM